jgi:methyl-accepting chemotaxis protein
MIVALSGVTSAAGQFRVYIARAVPLLLAISDMYAQGLQSEQATRNLILNPADGQAAKNYAAAVAAFDAAHQVARAASRDRTELAGHLSTAQAAWQAVESLRRGAQRLAKEGRAADAVQLLVEQETPKWRETKAALLAALSLGRARSRQTAEDIDRRSRRHWWTSLALFAVVGAVCATLGATLALPLIRSIRAMSESLAGLACGGGDLTTRLEVRRADELGRLAGAFNGFMDALTEIIGRTKVVAARVVAASGELTGDGEPLSSGSQEQASSLEEAAASLEEISWAVNQNADNAQQANQLALQSRQIADRGGEVVGTAVTAMSEMTEASTKIAVIVEAGSDAVPRSGRTREEIVASVKRVSDVIAEIAAASREQTSGIDQVNGAVAQMDQVVQGNAAQTEELSSTAQSLATQAQQLEALGGRFRLDDDRGVPVTSPPRSRAVRAASAEPRRSLPAPVVARLRPARAATHGKPHREPDELAATAVLAGAGASNGSGASRRTGSRSSEAAVA